MADVPEIIKDLRDSTDNLIKYAEIQTKTADVLSQRIDVLSERLELLMRRVDALERIGRVE